MECVVYGVGSTYVYEVRETLRRLAWRVRGYVSNLPHGNRPDDLRPLLDVADLPQEWLSLPVAFALLTPGYRAALERETRALGFDLFPAVVDPTAVIASTAVLEEGTVVNAVAVIGARTAVGRFVFVNRSASVGHDVAIEDYASLGPGCVLCGSTRIEAGAFVGAGSTLLPGVVVGANAVVGAGAVVVHDVPAHSVVVGNPAKVVQRGVAGYNGVGIDRAGLTL